MFKRCFDMGDGIGITQEQCEAMWNNIQLDDHVMTVLSDDYVDAAAATDVAAASINATAATTNVAAAATDAGAATTNVALPGDCVEVWWDEDEQYFPCVVTQQRADSDDSTASECKYDGETQRHWHDLEEERFRHILPTVGRLSNLTVPVIRKRLRKEGKVFDSTARKPALVTLLFNVLVGRSGNLN